MVVVLPEPLLPRRPKISPFWTSKERSLMMVLPAKVMPKFSTLTKGVAVSVVFAVFVDFCARIWYIVAFLGSF